MAPLPFHGTRTRCTWVASPGAVHTCQVGQIAAASSGRSSSRLHCPASARPRRRRQQRASNWAVPCANGRDWRRGVARAQWPRGTQRSATRWAGQTPRWAWVPRPRRRCAGDPAV